MVPFRAVFFPHCSSPFYAYSRYSSHRLVSLLRFADDAILSGLISGWEKRLPVTRSKSVLCQFCLSGGCGPSGPESHGTRAASSRRTALSMSQLQPQKVGVSLLSSSDPLNQSTVGFPAAGCNTGVALPNAFEPDSDSQEEERELPL